MGEKKRKVATQVDLLAASPFFQKIVLEHLDCTIIKISSFIKYILDIISVVEYSCKECGELNYLNPRTFWNKTDFGVECKSCETTNTVTIVMGELKKQI